MFLFWINFFYIQVEIERWPSDFKNKTFRLQEISKKPKRWFRVKIDDVSEIPTQQHDNELRKLNQNEYVLVYKNTPNSLHTVYVHKYHASSKMVECINSHGPNDEFPSISLKDIVKLYRVTCSAVDTAKMPGIKQHWLQCLNLNFLFQLRSQKDYVRM